MVVVHMKRIYKDVTIVIVKNIKICLLLLSIIICCAGCTTTKGNTFKETTKADIKKNGQSSPASNPDADTASLSDPTAIPVQTPAPEEGSSTDLNQLTIETVPQNAEVFIESKYYGQSPVTVKNLSIGTIGIKITKDGCQDYEAFYAFKGGHQTYNVRLSRITGKISVSIEPQNAEIIYDNEKIASGQSDVPVGRNILSARCFGYATHEEQIEIREGVTTEVRITLEKTSFTVSPVRVSNESFNPGEDGPLSKTEISFYVSAQGKGSLVIRNEKGSAVYTYDFGSFTTWTQKVTWNGKSGDGSPLPDGQYSIEVTCSDILNEGEVKTKTSVRIDSSSEVSFGSVYCGSAGLVFCPSPLTLPDNALQLSVLALAHEEPADGKTLWMVPTVTSLRYGISDDIEVDVLNGIIYSNYLALPFLLGVSFKYKYADAGDLLKFQGAIDARISYHYGTGSDTFTDFTGLSIGFPMNIKLGIITLSLCPELTASPWKVTNAPDYISTTGNYEWLYLRGGLVLGTDSFSLSASVSLRTLPFQDGIGIDLPLMGAVEVKCVIPGTRIYLSAVGSIEFNSMESYLISGGIGLGYIFTTR
jgi:hypothetical protein